MGSHTHSNRAQVEANRRWLAKHPEKVIEYREKRKAKEKWRREHDPQYDEYRKSQDREKSKRYRHEHKDKESARFKRWMEIHPEEVEKKWKRFHDSSEHKMKTCAEYYMRLRANKRRRRAVMKVLEGGKYKPRFSIRIPDWAVKGECVLDNRSGLIAANITPEQKAYARELAIERRAAMRDRR